MKSYWLATALSLALTSASFAESIPHLPQPPLPPRRLPLPPRPLPPRPMPPRPPVVREQARQSVIFHGEIYRFGLGPQRNLEYAMGHDHYRFNLGGVLTSAPYAVVLGENIIILARGQDNAMYFRTLHHDWQSLGGTVYGILDVFRERNDVFVVAQGTDGIYMRSLRAGWRRIR
jgi:hypothetical protein